MRSPVVVVAVDGPLDALLLGLPVRTARLPMPATAPLADRRRLPCPVYARRGDDDARQTPDGRLFVGGGRDRHEAAEGTSAADPTAEVQAEIDLVASRMAGEPVTVSDRRAASMGYTVDGRPVCGVVERANAGGVAVCGGYSSIDNLVGPVAAHAAVAALPDGAEVPGWALDPAVVRYWGAQGLHVGAGSSGTMTR